MKSLRQLENEASNRRAQLDAKWLEVQSRLTLPGLAKEALKHIDSQIRPLPPPALLAVKRHPVIAAGILAGAAWLLKRAFRPMRRSLRNGHTQSANHTRVPPAKLKTLKKETLHEIN